VKQLENRVREINCIITELLETERNYLNFLEVIDSLYIQPFESKIEAKKPIISRDEMKILFGNSK